MLPKIYRRAGDPIGAGACPLSVAGLTFLDVHSRNQAAAHLIDVYHVAVADHGTVERTHDLPNLNGRSTVGTHHDLQRLDMRIDLGPLPDPVLTDRGLPMQTSSLPSIRPIDVLVR